jgi:hypothetical protein
MKAKAFVCVLVYCVVAGVGGYASEKQAIAVEDALKKFEGTFENNEYSTWAQPQRCTIEAGGKILEYVRIT